MVRDLPSHEGETEGHPKPRPLQGCKDNSLLELPYFTFLGRISFVGAHMHFDINKVIIKMAII
jgi:hypothetical protein